MTLGVEDERFKLRRSLQRQYGGVGVLVVVLQAQLDALAFEGAGVGLYLYVLLQQPVDSLLGFEEPGGCGRLRVQLELLLYGLGEVPAEEDKGVPAMTLGVQKTPGFIGCAVQGLMVFKCGRAFIRSGCKCSRIGNMSYARGLILAWSDLPGKQYVMS